MNEIKTAAIIGAGALGLMYAGMMKEKLGDNCFFLSDNNRCEKIRNSSFSINGAPRRFHAATPSDMESGAEKKPDLILISVKNHHLEDISPLVESAVHEDTIIISVLNGIESENFLRRRFPGAVVVSTVAVGMDAVKEETALNYTSAGKLLIGIEDADESHHALKSLEGLFKSCNMAYEIPSDIQRALWWKWMINIGVNQVSAVTGANYGVFHTQRDIQELMEWAMQETIDVAKAAGVDLRDDDIENWYPILRSLGAENKTSMLQDIEARRKTEVEAFSGKLISTAEEHGVDVPVNRILFRIISTKELLYS
ncbi:MAG: ketopantoate reductase family protein [Spirochaetales bacterium]|uniref:2-dehydropantoate 2-reductase n=1 Tax=Candidatus Thalassospirochaeta sargassi TaxID=3119039 RepID=A0AAJ1I9X0_9SPIO|nr:ketopantoate reductase family protein [Spirochaetales bacterium]